MMTVASFAFPICLCRASFAATVCSRAARRSVYAAWGCGKSCLRVAQVSLLLEGAQISVGRGRSSRSRSCESQGTRDQVLIAAKPPGDCAATKSKPQDYCCGSAAVGMYIGAGGGVQAGSGTWLAW